ncbi:MAG: serine/threonine protein kinase [Lentisphaeria bacterium]|nr:serine/threonine protein kinase [Lentisphaeria bacterium]
MAEPLKVNCRTCHAKLDVGEFAPFEQVACPQCGTVIRVPMRFDRYLLEKVCGKGGDSIVYRAIDPELSRRVAIKIGNGVSADGEADPRFVNSARISGILSDPGVVPVYNCGICDNRSFLVMRFMEHGDLERMLKHHELPEHSVILSWIAGIIPALIEARNKNIVHHDIKPGNIMLTAENSPKIGDWDLADCRTQGDYQTPCSEWASPIYASPERIYCGCEDYRGDIFCLGVTIYELLSKQAPFGLSGSTEEIYDRRKNMEFVPLAEILPETMPELSRIVSAMLEYLPENRPDYEEILKVIKQAVDYKKDMEKGSCSGHSGRISWFRKN